MHKAKKYLGQNFLKSEAALRKIIEAGEVTREDTVLEIGPGKGALTVRLLERAGRVIAVEKDDELVEFLKEKFKREIGEGKLVIIHDDILNFSPPQKYKIIANIPYNITGAILKKFLTAERQPERMILMLQQEVARRIVALPRRGGASGRESILSVSVKAYGTPKLIMKVPARYFSPAPRVDSAIIAITNISREIFRKSNVSEEKFWHIVKQGFAHKRKKLSSNLKNELAQGINQPFVEKNNKKLTLLEELGDKRAENLTLADWLTLST